MSKARLFFQWISYLHAVGYDAREALFINVDETPVPLFMGRRLGYKKRSPGPALRQAMRVPVNIYQARHHCTVMGAICNQPEVQPLLPQIVLPNTKGAVRVWNRISRSGGMPLNVHIILGERGWFTVTSLLKYLSILHSVLSTTGYSRVVLVWDAARSHMSLPVLRRIRRYGWMPLYIPSHMTPYLQPLDVFVFKSLKQCIHNAVFAQCSRTSSSHVNVEDWGKAICQAVGAFFATCTSAADQMSACGFYVRNSAVRKTLLSLVLPADLPLIRKLTIGELKTVVGIHSHPMWRRCFPHAVPDEYLLLPVQLYPPLRRCSSKRCVPPGA